ncbi:MAG: hypothetical protein IKI69_01840 [Oscillospiraceae bacterium]|nr:hypothetical protein [Oscillospiraceae bacterium]
MNTLAEPFLKYLTRFISSLKNERIPLFNALADILKVSVDWLLGRNSPA